MENTEAEILRPFGPKRKIIHRKPNYIGSLLLNIHFFGNFVKNIPLYLKLRKFYKTRPQNDKPRVVMFSDNLDEINGIAINSREILKKHRKLGNDVFLIGTAFHTRDGGFVEKNGAILLPQIFSLEQYGYKDSEMAIPDMAAIVPFLRKFPIDLLTIETPSAGAAMATFIAKIVGIPVTFHYRLDMLSYMKILNVGKFEYFFVRIWLIILSYITRPIVVPSQDFKEKVHHEFKVPYEQIKLIRRGINLSHFSPIPSPEHPWPHPESKKVRFLYVGRISKEKELVFLEQVWLKFRQDHSEAELVFVGKGPYYDSITQNLRDCPEVTFTGKMQGEALSAMYAHADIFLFPSGTDTFGNVVVEAATCGCIPIVSDKGGPKDIVDNLSIGEVVSYRSENDWLQAMDHYYHMKLNDATSLEQLKAEIHQHSQYYSLESSCKDFWDFYLDTLKDKAPRK